MLIRISLVCLASCEDSHPMNLIEDYYNSERNDFHKSSSFSKNKVPIQEVRMRDKVE